MITAFCSFDRRFSWYLEICGDYSRVWTRGLGFFFACPNLGLAVRVQYLLGLVLTLIGTSHNSLWNPPIGRKLNIKKPVSRQWQCSLHGRKHTLKNHNVANFKLKSSKRKGFPIPEPVKPGSYFLRMMRRHELWSRKFADYFASVDMCSTSPAKCLQRRQRCHVNIRIAFPRSGLKIHRTPW